MNVFLFSTYKEFLKSFIAQSNTRGVISQIATACGCDRTYISQVLNGKADLTPDHMLQFCEHFGLNDAESRYLLLLLLHDRSASTVARKSLATQIKEIKTEALTLSNKVYRKEKPKEISQELRTLYYSSWKYGAIHILTSIPEYQTPAAISQKTQLPLTTVNQVLRDLIEMRVVTTEKGRFVHAGGDIYLPSHHPQTAAHHLTWRVKAVERSLEKDDVHYTLAFSVSQDDVEKLRQQIIELIEEQRNLVRSSGTDVACAFCVDFFSL